MPQIMGCILYTLLARCHYEAFCPGRKVFFISYECIYVDKAVLSSPSLGNGLIRMEGRVGPGRGLGGGGSKVNSLHKSLQTIILKCDVIEHVFALTKIAREVYQSQWYLTPF